MPAISESLRRERWPTRRWSRMNSPRSCQRCSSSSFMEARLRDSREQPLVGRELLEQRVDARFARLVATGDLRRQRVDAVEEVLAVARDLVLERFERLRERAQLSVVQRWQLRHATRTGDAFELRLELGR